MRKSIFGLILLAVFAIQPASAQWWCAFTTSEACGNVRVLPERKGMCDQFVPEAFQLIFGPPPQGPGCESNAGKVHYFTEVKRYVPGSEVVVGGPSAEEFEKYGFGKPLVYTMKYGEYERRSVAFPGKEWDGPVPRGYLALAAEHYPYPIMSSVATRAIAGGACIAKLVKQVPPSYRKTNTENCKAKESE